MINLSIQIKLITFSFIFGFLLSFFIDEFYSRLNKIKKIYEIVLSFLLVAFMSSIYFIGIQIISNSILHIYSIICIVFGFIFYDLIIKIIANNNKR